MPGFILHVRKDGEWTRHKESYETYEDAVLCGQKIAPRNFTIECPMNRVPTREEQLLLPLVRKACVSRVARLDRWLDSI